MRSRLGRLSAEIRSHSPSIGGRGRSWTPPRHILLLAALLAGALALAVAVRWMVTRRPDRSADEIGSSNSAALAAEPSGDRAEATADPRRPVGRLAR